MSFQESQRLNLGIRMLALVGMIPGVIIVAKTYHEQPTSENLIILLGMILLPVVTYSFFLHNQAKTRIDSLGVHYYYWPFVLRWRTINWSDIQKVHIKNISPLTDFGGWGYKLGRKKKGIILSGDKAIYIHLKNEKVFAITTNQPEQARSAISLWAVEKLV